MGEEEVKEEQSSKVDESNQSSVAGESIDQAGLTSRQAKQFVRFVLDSENYQFSLSECRRSSGLDWVYITVAAEVPQLPKYDIRSDEPLTIGFSHTDDHLPIVLSCRPDFPHVPHLNLMTRRDIKCLCLFAESHAELAYRWTPALLGQRVLWWLSKTARGELHGDDQQLEQFIVGTTQRPIVLPSELFDYEFWENGQVLPFSVHEVDAGLGRRVLVTDSANVTSIHRTSKVFSLLLFGLPVQEHGIMHIEPRNLRDLHDLCSEAGYNLVNELAEKLRSLAKESKLNHASAGTFIVIAIPKVRHAGGQVEALDLYAFRCGQPINTDNVLLGKEQAPLIDLSPGELGKLLNVLEAHQGRYVALFRSELTAGRQEASGINVEMLLPRSALTPSEAARFNGSENSDDRQLLAVGVGAVGSQIVMNLVRQGYGRWTAVDEDFILPHNLARHASDGAAVGLPKVVDIAREANSLFDTAPVVTSIVADVLANGDATESVWEAAAKADAIIDFSASVAVAHRLTSSIAGGSRRMSVFLSPSGQDLVVMSETADRTLTLDSIETQYLRALLRDKGLRDHLKGGGERILYGGSCRDLSARISQELVSIHAGIGAAAIRQSLGQEDAQLSVWRCDREQMTVGRIDVNLSPSVTCQASGWAVVLDEGLKETLMSLRRERLPYETCGVLLGHIDTQQQRIYVAEVLPAPPDSVEEEDGCIRGTEGLSEKIKAVSEVTLGQLEYVGEWHSHPDGELVLPSVLDTQQMNWVKSKMHPEGKPALIMIACDKEALTVYITEPYDDKPSDTEGIEESIDQQHRHQAVLGSECRFNQS